MVSDFYSGPGIARLFLGVAFLSTMSVASAEPDEFGMGAVFDEDVYEAAPRGAPLTRGSYRGLPSRYSMEPFTPTPGDQGAQGSCVGWAVAYAARTMAEARIQEFDSRHTINNHVFSPAYVYNQIVREGCKGGSLPTDALRLLEERGVPLMRDFPYDDDTCSQPIRTAHHERASQYRIDDWRRLTSPSSRAKHVPVRRAVAAGRPVMIGMAVPHSFMDSERIRSNNGRWIPTSEDRAQLKRGDTGGHAMTVVGYDDERFGGAFRVINSWGTEWGDGGYVWIAYDDFQAFVLQTYEIVRHEPPPPATPDVGGTVTFHHIDGSLMQASRREEMVWQMTEPYPSGTRFRVELESEYPGYIYALGGDLTGEYVELFPRSRRVSAIVDKGDTLVMPGPTEDFYTRMDETVGMDFYVILYSRDELPIRDVVQAVNSAQGPIHERLESVLDERLDNLSNPEYGGRGIQFSAHVGDEGVMPVIVEIEHVEARERSRDDQPPRIVVRSPEPDVFDEVASQTSVRHIDERRFRIRGVAQDEGAIRGVEVAGAISSRFSSRGPFEAVVELAEGERSGEFVISAVDAADNKASETIHVSLD